MKETFSSHYFNIELQNLTKKILLGYFIGDEGKIVPNHKIEYLKVKDLIDIINYELTPKNPLNLKPIKP